MLHNTVSCQEKAIVAIVDCFLAFVPLEPATRQFTALGNRILTIIAPFFSSKNNIFIKSLLYNE